MRRAAVLTVGTELTSGLQADTNGPEIAARLTGAGFDVAEVVSTADALDETAGALARLVAACELVIVTGGLGPTHDDITREAASRALSRPLVRDESIVSTLQDVIRRHYDREAQDNVLRQADVLEGARVLPAVLGTAPGQVAETARGHVVILPGPPREMRPLLEAAFEVLGLADLARPFVAVTTGLSESDVQVAAQRVLAEHSGVSLTVLARPGEVRVVLFDAGAGPEALDAAGRAVCAALGDVCVSDAGASLAEAVLDLARSRSLTLATAESCTGGMIAAALTDVPGSSDVFLGGVVAYRNALKSSALGVPPEVVDSYGAVSAETAIAMAEGARALTGAAWAVSVTGVAGPGGGTAGKPVGTVWFAVAGPDGSTPSERHFPGDRAAVRMRSTATGLDLLRRAIIASG